MSKATQFYQRLAVTTFMARACIYCATRGDIAAARIIMRCSRSVATGVSL